MMPRWIVDHAVAERLGVPPPGLIVVPRRPAPFWRRRSGRWSALDPDCVATLLADSPASAAILARSGMADPGAVCLPQLGRLFGHEVLWLPDGLDEAAWSVGITCGLGDLGADRIARIVDVVCCGPGIAPSFPRREWGGGIAVPALRPATLARWAECAWRACRWCVGGGLPGRACVRCGVAVEGVAA